MRPQRVGTRPTLALLVVITAAFVVIRPMPATGQGAPPAPPSVAAAPSVPSWERDAAAADWATTPQDAERRLLRQYYMAALQQFVVGTFPATFGGMWIADDGQIHLAFTAAAHDSTTTTATAVSTAYPHFWPSDFVAETVDYTWTSVLAAYNAVQADWVAGARDLGLIAGGLDAQNNRVVIFAADGAAAAFFTSRYAPLSVEGTPLVQAEVQTVSAQPMHHDPDVQPDCHHRGECRNPMRGGIVLDGLDGGPCSTGFIATNQRGSDYVLTAGHCTAGGRMGYHDSLPVGGASAEGTHNLPFSPVDAARVLIDPPSGGDPLWLNEAVVYANYNTQRQRITTVRQASEAVEGIRICLAGRNVPGYESRCARIRFQFFFYVQDRDPTDNVPGVPKIAQFLVNNYPGTACEGGDSGGAGFAIYSAYGILSSGGFVPELGSVCIFSHIQFVQQVLEVRVKT